ncbi:hypothetical protein F4803DRAFT_557599 [Xylaria telfairii]|nr:hypothetical protein F4803DRAFT_557599 [Xylaria telfairii]
MQPKIASLSTELLLQILTWVRKISGKNSGLLQCLTVSKRWHGATIVVMYRHLALTTDVIESFASTFDPQLAGPHVRSLTLHVAQPTLVSYERNELINANNWIQEVLLRLPPILGTLDNLCSFSLRVSVTAPSFFFQVSRRAIQALINALPQSCVNLEIDTCGLDAIPSPLADPLSSQSSTHLCETLRRVLPRMHRVRIRLSSICPIVIGIFTKNEDTKTKFFIPIKAPHLETLFINCRRGHGLCHLCSNPTSPATTWSPWTSLVSALRQFADTPEACSPSAKICILGSPTINSLDEGAHKTIIVADLHGRSACAFPILRVAPNIPDGWLMRVGQGRGIFSHLGALEEFAEGKQWADLSIGARLHLKIAETEGEEVLTLPIVDEREWRATHARKSCVVWKNEALLNRLPEHSVDPNYLCSQLAVAKGLVLDRMQMAKLGKAALRSRKVRASYGVVTRERYNKHSHLGKQPTLSTIDGELWIEGEIKWVMRKGDNIETEKSGKDHGFSHAFRAGGKLGAVRRELVIRHKDRDQLPTGRDNADVFTLCHIEPDLSTVDSKYIVERQCRKSPLKFWKQAPSYYEIKYAVNFVIGSMDARF